MDKSEQIYISFVLIIIYIYILSPLLDVFRLYQLRSWPERGGKEEENKEAKPVRSFRRHCIYNLLFTLIDLLCLPFFILVSCLLPSQIFCSFLITNPFSFFSYWKIVLLGPWRINEFREEWKLKVRQLLLLSSSNHAPFISLCFL